jgi:hypothetical protein
MNWIVDTITNTQSWYISVAMSWTLFILICSNIIKAHWLWATVPFLALVIVTIVVTVLGYLIDKIID